MRKDVHLAALRAATRVALGITVLAGCSSGQDEAPVQDDEALHTKKESTATCTVDAGAAPTFTCDDLVEAAFPNAGNYPGKKITITDAVKSCCRQSLVDKAALATRRWDCCANIDEDDRYSIHGGAACTPWGPPVPPAMKRRDVTDGDSFATGVA